AATQFVGSIAFRKRPPRGSLADRLHFRNDRRAERRGHHARERTRKCWSARRADQTLSPVRALRASFEIFKSAAAQSRLRTISRDVLTFAAARHGFLPGNAQAQRCHSHDSPRADFGTGRRSANAAVVERKSRTRSGSFGPIGIFSQAIRRGRRQSFPAPLVDLPPHSSPVRA